MDKIRKYIDTWRNDITDFVIYFKSRRSSCFSSLFWLKITFNICSCISLCVLPLIWWLYDFYICPVTCFHKSLKQRRKLKIPNWNITMRLIAWFIGLLPIEFWWPPCDLMVVHFFFPKVTVRPPISNSCFLTSFLLFDHILGEKIIRRIRFVEIDKIYAAPSLLTLDWQSTLVDYLTNEYIVK